MITIRYQNGQAVEAITLSRTDNSMRIIVPGSEDVLELRHLRGQWITEDCEPVDIEYPSRPNNITLTEEDCICSAELAARLIRLLYSDSSEDVAETAGPATQRKAWGAASFA